MGTAHPRTAARWCPHALSRCHDPQVHLRCCCHLVAALEDPQEQFYATAEQHPGASQQRVELALPLVHVRL